MAPMAGGAVGGGDAAAAEEKTEFDLVLDSFPADKKIAVLKIVRELTGLGLKDAKDMVEKAPCTVKEGASKAECEEAQKKLEDAGVRSRSAGHRAPAGRAARPRPGFRAAVLADELAGDVG